MPGAIGWQALRRAQALHHRGVEQMSRSRPAAAARLLRAGLTILGWNGTVGSVRWPPASALAARTMISLALTEAELGRSDSGFALLDQAEVMVRPADRGALVQQRGLLFILAGRMDDALHCLDEAVALLSRSDEKFVLAATLLNRGLLHHNAGRIGSAKADLERCEQVAGPQRPLLLAKATHNQGHCDLLRGDIPGALRHFDRAASHYAAVGAGPLLGMVALDRARALLAAGLTTEAATELDAALPLLSARNVRRDRAEAELVRAQIALAARDWDTAQVWARRAKMRFASQGNDSWAAVAMLVQQHATLERGILPGRRTAFGTVAIRTQQLATQLRAMGLNNDADTAALLAAAAYRMAGQNDAALAAARACRARTSVSNEVRRRLVLAELAADGGDRGAVLRHCRLGLASLRRYQGRFGSLDLRTGSAALGAELAGAGLESALVTGSVATVYAWLERSRAQTFGARPVRPPADGPTSEAVAELRRLAIVIRAAELAGARPVGELRRCAELERAVRARGWLVGGNGESSRPVDFSEVMRELARLDSALVSFAVHRGSTMALVGTERGGRLASLGAWATVKEAATRLHHDLDALCALVLPTGLEAVIRTSARRQASSLADLLITPLLPTIGDRDVVLVPTRALSAVPWGVLPGLQGRPVTVAPSASAWLRGSQHQSAGVPASPPLLVAGPGLSHAPAEVNGIAAMYPDAIVLNETDATVEKVLDQMDGRAVVHVAAHGHHEHDNVLFSRLDLIDGPLMAYDVQQLRAAPEQVILSACDLGRTVVRTGDELLGFTAALLYTGTRTVVSCVNRVLDHHAVEIMAAYHRNQMAGHRPAKALANASAAAPLNPFVCFGVG